MSAKRENKVGDWTLMGKTLACLPRVAGETPAVPVKSSLRHQTEILRFNGLALIVNLRFARRPCLPALVNPEPLIRIETNHSLHGSREIGSVQLNVFCVVAGAH